MANGTIAFDTLTTSDSKNTGTEKSIDTSYLYNGVNKFWMQTQGDLITDNIQDSFNSSTVTDIGTGFINTNFTNSFANTGYATSNIGMNGDHILNGANEIFTNTCRFSHYNQSNSSIDPGVAAYIAVGDIA